MAPFRSLLWGGFINASGIHFLLKYRQVTVSSLGLQLNDEGSAVANTT